MKKILLLVLLLVGRAAAMTINDFEHSHPIDHLPGESSELPAAFQAGQASLGFGSTDEDKDQFRNLSMLNFSTFITHEMDSDGERTGPVGLYRSSEPVDFGDFSIFWRMESDYLQEGSDFPIVQELNLLHLEPNEPLFRFIGKCTALRRLTLPFNSGAILQSESLVLAPTIRELSISNAELSKDLVDRLASLKELEVLILDTCYLPLDPNEWGDLSKLTQVKDLRIFRGTVEMYLGFFEKGHPGIESLSVSEGAIRHLRPMMRELYRGVEDASLLKIRFPNLDAFTVNFEWFKKSNVIGRKQPVVIESERFEAKGGKVTFNFYQHEEEPVAASQESNN